MKKTKIVCSISNLNCSVEFLRSLFFSGMNVVRINTAHADADGIREIIRNTRTVSPRIGILVDTKGPEVRTTKCDLPIAYLTDEIVTIAGRPDVETTHDFINVSYVDIAKDVPVGKHLLFDDGALDIEVVANDGKKLTGVVQNDGVLGSRKSVNIPGVHIELPALTPRDVENIKLSIEEKVDFIAHSFVRNASDVKAVQDILDEYNSPIKIVSKIENQEGVDNIDEILDGSYGIMIARGDLGIEVPIEQIPGIQRQLIDKCIARHRPVIVATQMLHSMITNPRPTRAEVADIANAIYSRTDALMLSGETAAGKYPLEAVRTMASIAEQAEQDLERQHKPQRALPDNCDQREFLAHTAISSTIHMGVKGIISDTETGLTARYLSAMRGSTFVLAICYKEQTQRFLTLSYGILPIHQRKFVSSEYIFLASLRMLRQKGYINLEDKIAYLSGSFGKDSTTTFIEINEVGKVFAHDYRFHLPTHVASEESEKREKMK